MNITISNRDVTRVLDRAEAFCRDVESHAIGEVRDAVDRILADAVRNAPVDTGILRSEGRADVQIVASGIEADIEFGGLASEYAAYQHDTEGLNHPKGGRDHYLYGRPDSAWSQTSESAMVESVGRALEDAFVREVQS